MSFKGMIKFCEEFALKEKIKPIEEMSFLAKDLMINLTKLNYE